MRKSLDGDWVVPDEQTMVMCQMFAEEFPAHCKMNKKYLKFLDGSGEVYFSMDVGEAMDQLNRKRERIEG